MVNSNVNLVITHCLVHKLFLQFSSNEISLKLLFMFSDPSVGRVSLDTGPDRASTVEPSSGLRSLRRRPESGQRWRGKGQIEKSFRKSQRKNVS